jgi:hypothetical protein
MKTPLIPFVLLIATITLGATVPQGLLVDGKFRIKGVPMKGARVIVERNGVQVQVLHDDISRFTLNLDLQQDYVLHFVREGCLSKTLHFDTHMPESSMAAAPFRFPFLVTLEPKPMGSVVGYAKAVGVVVFDTATGDFDYSTNYALVRERTKRLGSVDVQRTLPRALPDAPGSFDGSARPELMKEATEPGFTPKQGQRSIARSRSGIKPDRTAPPSPSVTAVVAPPEEPRQDGRTEEIEVRPAYVARMVRITEQGRTREYRKVTHRYGEVHWFCNGTSCSESLYNKLVAK